MTFKPAGKLIRSKGSGRKNKSSRMEPKERFDGEGGSGGTQTEERSEDLPSDRPAEQRPSRGRKSVKNLSDASPSKGQWRVDSGISRKRKVSVFITLCCYRV